MQWISEAELCRFWAYKDSIVFSRGQENAHAEVGQQMLVERVRGQKCLRTFIAGIQLREAGIQLRDASLGV